MSGGRLGQRSGPLNRKEIPVTTRVSFATRVGRSVLAALGAVSLSAAVLTAPAHAADTGLFGTQDATYDGVYRQSLAIAGLAAADARIPAAAVNWLADQQCADGSFEAFRSNTSTPCSPSDPKKFSGPDTNSTAMAAIALYLAGRTAPARDAIVWLNDVQNDDWGFPFHSGGASDANSTALSVMALQTVQPQDRSGRVPNAQEWLGTLKLKCASGGGLAYQKGSKANGLASAQGLMGLAGALPVSAQDDLSADPTCRKRNTNANVGAFVATAIDDDGALTSDFGSGADYTSTGWALLGLTAFGTGSSAVPTALATLQDNVRSYAYADNEVVPGAVGLLLLVAEATDSNPRDFGGVNLVRALSRSLQ